MPEIQFDIDLENPVVRESFDRVAKVQKAFVREVGEYSEQAEEEEESYRAYFSDSWKTDIKTKREARGLPVSDVARFASVVDTISGNERQNRTDTHIFPFERDDQLTADVGNLYLKYRNRKEQQWHADSLAFINAIVSKRAHYEFFLRNNPKDGSLETIRVLRPASEVYVQKPFRDITASDSIGTFHAQWVFVEDVIKQYKEKVKTLGLLDFTPQDRKPRNEITHLLDAYDFPDLKNNDYFFNKEKTMVRVIRYWRRHRKPIYQIINPNPASFKDILIGSEGSKSKAIEKAIAFIAERPEIAIGYLQMSPLVVDNEVINELNDKTIEYVAKEFIEEQFKDVYSFHAISGRVELEYEEEYGDFIPWTHMFCYFVDGRAGGLHERIKDLIQEVNFIHAKLMQRLGTMGKMPLGIEEDATEMKPDVIKQNYEDGGIIIFKPDAIRKNKFHAFEDKTLSSIPAYITLEESLNNTIKELTGANDPLQGRSPGANTAGIAIELLQRTGSALIAPTLDNYKRFKMENARMEVEMLLRAYKLRPQLTAYKLVRVVGAMLNLPGQQQSKLAEVMQQVDQTTEEGDELGMVTFMLSLLERMRGMEYDFTIDEFIHSPSLRFAQLQQLSTMASSLAFPVDPSAIIESMELPQQLKDRLLAFLGAQEGEQQVLNRGNQGGFNTKGSPPSLKSINSNGGQ